MPESYPLPSHAASFWIAGEDLMVAFPAQGPEGRGSTLRFPASPNGLKAAITVLKGRQAHADELRIAQRGTPTQYELERAMVGDAKYAGILRAMQDDKKVKRAAAAEARAQLKELGL